MPEQGQLLDNLLDLLHSRPELRMPRPKKYKMHPATWDAVRREIADKDPTGQEFWRWQTYQVYGVPVEIDATLSMDEIETHWFGE